MSFIESLRSEADAKRQEWQLIRDRIAEAEAEREQLRGYIDRLNPLLVAHALPPIDVVERRSEGRGFAKPGNRGSGNMLERLSPFESVSLVDAIRTVLSDGVER